MIGDDWITTQEAADLSGYHPDHLRRLIRAGEIRARKLSFLWLVSRQSLMDYLSKANESSDNRRGPKS